MKRLLVVVVATVVALGVCEVLIAVLPVSLRPAPLFPGDIVPELDATTDPLIGWKLPPSTVFEEATGEYSVSYASNSLGFRSRREYSADPPPVVFLGDSYTFGSGVQDDETFVALVDRELGAEVPCYNMGIGGFGIDQMWMTLRHYALPLQPRAVVLAFIRYDLDRSLSAYRRGHIWREKPVYRVADGELVPMTVSNRPGAVQRLLLQRSGLVAVWRKVEHSLARRYEVGRTWKVNRALFEAIRDDCAEAGAALLVVHIPVNRQHPTPVFDRVFAEIGVPYLDLGEWMPEDSDGLYYPEDRHLTPAGHRSVASVIVEQLRSEPRYLERAGHDDRHEATETSQQGA